jgi:hypothetical protein
MNPGREVDVRMELLQEYSNVFSIRIPESDCCSNEKVEFSEKVNEGSPMQPNQHQFYLEASSLLKTKKKQNHLIWYQRILICTENSSKNILILSSNLKRSGSERCNTLSFLSFLIFLK